MPDGRTFKAAQTGGPSGGCIPAEHLDTPMDYESLRALGSIMGSGGLIVMDDTSCMPDVAKFFMEFCTDESCGKCVPCRVGTVQMHRILERITNGSATADDLEILEELCVMVQETSLCGLGMSAPEPGAQHAALLPRRVRGPHPAPRVPGRRLPDDRSADAGPGGRAAAPHSRAGNRPGGAGVRRGDEQWQS